MDEGDRHALPNGGGDALDRTEAHIAGGLHERIVDAFIEMVTVHGDRRELLFELRAYHGDSGLSVCRPPQPCE